MYLLSVGVCSKNPVMSSNRESIYDEGKGLQQLVISIPATSIALQTHWGTSPSGNYKNRAFKMLANMDRFQEYTRKIKGAKNS